MPEMTMTRFQMDLQFLNYYWGEIDGVKGSQTKKATKQFQKDNGLTADGIIGQETIDVMRALICSIQSIVGVEQDGVAGDNTKEATARWQDAHGLTPDGIAGEQTRDAMFGEPQPEPQPTPSEWNFPHFQRSEFACHCGCGADNICFDTVQLLEDIRSYFGDRPIIVTSGVRCPQHNAEVGGVQGSKHCPHDHNGEWVGTAADFYVSGISTSTLLRYCQQLVNEGRARYTYTNNAGMNGVVHIDLG